MFVSKKLNVQKWNRNKLASEHSSPGRSGGGAGKGGRACSYVSEIWISALKKSMLIDGDDISNDVITRGACFQVFFKCLFTFALVSASRRLTKIWQLSRRGATVELEAEFKFQGRSCKLCFLFPPPHQIARRLALKGLAVWPLSSSYLNIICQLRFPIRSLCTMELNVNDEITYTRQKIFWAIIFIFHSIWWHFFSVTISNKIRDAAPLQCP